MKRLSQEGAPALALIWPLLLWVVAFLAPLVAVAFQGALSLGTLGGLLSSEYYRGVVKVTFHQALLSTLVSVVLGLPGAFLLARRRFWGQGLLKSLSTVPFVLPPILAVLGFILVFGNAGAMNDLRVWLLGADSPKWRFLYSLRGIVLAHAFYNFPLTLRIVGDAWESLPLSSTRAARSLGASPARSFWHADVPRLLPALGTAATLTFLYCFLSFAVVLVLGGGPNLSTLEVEVYRLVKYQLDFDQGSALALVESSVALALLGIYALADMKLRQRNLDHSTTTQKREKKALSRWESLWALAYALPAVLLILAPLAAVVINSFLGRATRSAPLTLTLSHWKRVFGGGRTAGVPAAAALRTFALGGLTAVTATATATLAAWYAYRRRGISVKLMEWGLGMPLGVSSVILGFGFLILARLVPPSPVLRLAALLAAHTMAALPFSYRLIAGAFRGISPRVPQAARCCGAGPWRTLWGIELPLVRRSMATAGVFSLALSAGELNATLILAPGNFTTMPMAIYRMIGAYDIFGACALGSVLILLCTGAFAALDRYGQKEHP
ncbi:MAG: iron ABC transporter permease [Spirochaetales bacterium]|nr:iron ABC transporter permease [Spirochaetales bacterium]